MRLAGEEGRLGGRDRVPRAVCNGHAQREGFAPAGRTAPVARFVRDDAQQPGSKRRAAAKAAEGAVGLDEAVLDRLFGIGRVPAEQVGGAKGESLVSAHDGLPRAKVAPLGALDELRVVQWPVHHWRFYTAPCVRVPPHAGTCCTVRGEPRSPQQTPSTPSPKQAGRSKSWMASRAATSSSTTRMAGR